MVAVRVILMEALQILQRVNDDLLSSWTAEFNVNASIVGPGTVYLLLIYKVSSFPIEFGTPGSKGFINEYAASLL